MDLISSVSDSVTPEIPYGHYIVSSLEQHGEAVAVVEVYSGREMTCKEILEETWKYVKLLRKAGLKKGDVVGFVLPFDMKYSPLFVAILYCGAVLFGCKFLFKSSIHSQLETVKPTLVITTDERLDELAADLKTYVPNVKSCLSFDQLKNIKPRCLGSIELDLPSAEEFNVHEDPAFIYLSSGTTGEPKCIVTNHYRAVAEAMPTRKQKLVQFFVSSTVHGFGLSLLFRGFVQGDKAVYASEITAQQLLEAISNFNVNVVYILNVNTLAGLVKLRQQLPERKWPFLKAICTVGTSFPVELIRKARDAFFGVSVCQGYGTTETGGIAAGFSNDSPPDSVGKPFPNVQVKIVDQNSGKDLTCGQKGEICVRGIKLLMKYVLKDGSVIKPLKEGWFHTGDLGYYDESGYLYISGRIKDLIKTQPGDLSAMPAEIENVLLCHDKINDVSVVGVPHPDYGEAPKAFVVREDDSLTKEEVHAFFESKVENVMRLDGGVEFIETIPRTELGKPLRRQLLELSLDNKV